MGEDKKSWSDLPRAVFFEITRPARASRPKKNKFDFPPQDIPRLSVGVWALDQGSSSKESARAHDARSARFHERFKAMARSANHSYGAASEGEPWSFYVSSTSSTLLPLDDAGLAPEQIIEKEAADWEQTRLGIAMWAKEEFEEGSYRLTSGELETRFDDQAESLRELKARLERREIEAVAPASPERSGARAASL